MKQPPGGRPDASDLRIAILRASFNASVVEGLLAGARAALAEMGADQGGVTVVDVPGAFELPLAAREAAGSGRFDAVVALGAVIRGETDHYEHIAREAAHGLAAVARETGVPIGFGVLTVAEERQARARSAPGAENKGAEAARAAVAMVHALRRLRGTRGARRSVRPRTRSSGLARDPGRRAKPRLE